MIKGRVNLTLTEASKQKLDHMKELTSLTMSDIIRRMIDDYYEKFLEKNKLETRSFTDL